MDQTRESSEESTDSADFHRLSFWVRGPRSEATGTARSAVHDGRPSLKSLKSVEKTDSGGY
jgi:hypothetical protein